MGYTIQKQTGLLARVDTYGEALAWANAHPEVTEAAVFWGKGKTRSVMNFREWALIANHAVARLTAKGIDPSALLANTGDR